MAELRALLIAALALGAAAPQENPATFRVRHLDALTVERERELLELWEELTPSGRTELESRLAAAEVAGRGRFQRAPLDSLARVSRAMLHPGDDGELEPWFELVDSLDLRVVPGLFEAREAGRGEPMTVVLDALWDSPVDHRADTDVEVALLWRSEAGDELLARQEPATARALEAGFEMYIRPPESGPQTWRLLLEVRTEGGVVRSRGVLVECVSDLAERREELLGTGGGAGATDLAIRLERLRGEGLRLASADRLGPRLAVGEAPSAVLPRALAAEPGARVTASYALGEVRTDQEVIVLLPRRGEHPLDLLTGPVGRAWGELAATRGALVRTADPVVDRGAAGLRALVERHAQGGARSVVVVARGVSGQLLPGALAAEPLAGLGGLVLAESPGAHAAVRPTVSVPTLRLEAGVAGGQLQELGVEGGPRRSRVGLGAPPPFDALATPRWLGEWLGGE